MQSGNIGTEFETERGKLFFFCFFVLFFFCRDFLMEGNERGEEEKEREGEEEKREEEVERQEEERRERERGDGGGDGSIHQIEYSFCFLFRERGWRYRREISIVVALLCFVPFLFLEIGDGDKEQNIIRGRTAGVTLLMAFFWVSELIPIPITSIIPLFLFPLLVILPSKVVAPLYFNDTIALFIATNIIGLAMEKYRLHERIALVVLITAGKSPRKVIIGVMFVTALFSMFMSNTATTSVMAPLVVSLFASLRSAVGGEDVGDLVEKEEELDVDSIIEELNEQEKNFLTAALLATAYSASVGGAATLIGTGTNLAFMSVFSGHFPDAPELSFGRWMLFAGPFVFICLIVIWVWITFLFLRNIEEIRISVTALERRYRERGKMSIEELIIVIDLFFMMFFWLTRTSLFGDLDVEMPSCSCDDGCKSYGEASIRDSAIAVAGAIVLFIIPTFKRDCVSGKFTASSEKRMMNWSDCRKLSWGVALLLGAGYSLATALSITGLSTALGDFVYHIEDLPILPFILISCLFVSFVTEFVSNVAMANLILPIAAEIAMSHCENPLTYMIPVTLACSFAFMMPAATPPNAIVFSFNTIKVSEMVKAGFVLDIVCVILLSFWAYIFLPIVWDLEYGKPASWATDLTHC